MSSAEVHLPFKPQGHHKNQPSIQSTNNNTKGQSDKLRKRIKHERNGRRRSKSFSGHGINPKPVLPSKFLLGGNINDPLNLNSLQDEEINRAMNAVTPKSSPIPTPPRRKGQVEVIIPPNIRDPLNLIDCSDDAEYELQLCSPVKKGRKKRLKKKRTISTTTEVSDTDISPEADTPDCQTESAKIPDEVMPEAASASTSNVKQPKLTAVKDLTLELLSPKKDKPQKRKSEEYKEAKKVRYSLDKIVSPVVPQPGAWLKRLNSITKKSEPKQNKGEVVQMPKFKENDKKFQYGNYNRYYGYRNQNNEIDHRLKVFSHHPFLFQDKDILDIGCNIGHVTLSVARDFGARTVIGIDIDDKLISIARKNIKHYVKSVNSPRADEIHTQGRCQEREKCSSEFFPISMPILYGPIDVPGFDDCSKNRGFPKNVTFKRCNYVLDDDALLALEQPQYDTILCLSVTKWIHLNWGDNGLKQAFRRMYAQLRPGGRLILEPQNWASYKGKKKLTETIYRNYNSIEFFPNKFTEYLLSPAVGFAKSEILGYPQCHSKGFRRPIQLFTKSTMFPSERIDSTPFNITPNMKSESQNSDSVDYIYSGILNRYCTTAEENTEANIQIAKTLSHNTVKSSVEVANCDSTTDVSESKPCSEPVKTEGTVMEVEVEKKNCDVDVCIVESSTTKSDEVENCDEISTSECKLSSERKEEKDM
ncbi:7SK snRNA methylphosphate capping enzyme bin3-like isoform X2 [Coccinella septempunctata]|uniref:7SK snRNA methylphosphate capping enzyme bin3-like isoform X2 n=1 Tax=Coccinella septempunctata TaxID=41139 RepID=UPI001D091618|nr:7SK snRNA methylphosphate capping enzyme bin3-like isoform X2 [Coccinella septempunctata]